MDLMDISSEIQESLGRSYSVPDDIDEEDLMGGMVLLCPIREFVNFNLNLKLKFE